MDEIQNLSIENMKLKEQVQKLNEACDVLRDKLNIASQTEKDLRREFEGRVIICDSYVMRERCEQCEDSKDKDK